MKTEHTPGPWIVQADPEWTGKHPYHECRFITTKHKLIHEPAFSELSTGRTGFDEEEGRIIASMRDGEQQQANARLIAAAPDLLEALQDLCDDLERYVNSDDGDIPDWSLALRAIAKAKGERP